ncbi:uncharacterized protein LOC114014333 [Falco cherrug]|uniref:uncharacterized protein LOC114014333 n=1 Tax=Falco cherrug TaxID=345164 RepID=UPI0024798F2E|nr:uncharacterized protein LOC114014333 [Falco cherrug]
MLCTLMHALHTHSPLRHTLMAGMSAHTHLALSHLAHVFSHCMSDHTLPMHFPLCSCSCLANIYTAADQRCLPGMTALQHLPIPAAPGTSLPVPLDTKPCSHTPYLWGHAADPDLLAYSPLHPCRHLSPFPPSCSVHPPFIRPSTPSSVHLPDTFPRAVLGTLLLPLYLWLPAASRPSPPLPPSLLLPIPRSCILPLQLSLPNTHLSSLPPFSYSSFCPSHALPFFLFISTAHPPHPQISFLSIPPSFHHLAWASHGPSLGPPPLPATRIPRTPLAHVPPVPAVPRFTPLLQPLKFQSVLGWERRGRLRLPLPAPRRRAATLSAPAL